MLLVEFVASLSVFMLCVIFMRLWWPCLVHIHWPLILIIFIILVLATVMLHMSQWKCWNYLCLHRQRLQSTGPLVRKPPFFQMATVVVFCISIFYSIVSWYFEACGTPWWPGLVFPTVLFFYTGFACSSSSTNCLSSPSSELSSGEASEL